jgi:hypothetical protein
VKIEKAKKGSNYLLLPMFFLSVGLNAQNLTVKGKVIDLDSNAVHETAIVIQSASLDAITNDDSDYHLSNVSVGNVFDFRFIGYVIQKITVDKTTYT